jgi:hypothetical protein
MAEVLQFPPAQEMPRQRDIVEIVAAIMLVASGAARRVRLVNLAEPLGVAGEGAAQASAAGVAFRIERQDDHVEVVVGPLR